MSITYSLMLTL